MAFAARAATGTPQAPQSIGAISPRPAMRAITLAPHLTELMYAAGAGNRIVATVTSSDYPASAKLIPRIGNGLSVNIEQVLALKPDIVLAWQPSGAAQTLAPTLAALHIPLIYMAPRQLQDIPADIVKLGELFGTQASARPQAAALSRRRAALAAKYSGRRVVSAFIEVGTAPLYTIGHDPLINDTLRLCGGVNVYAHTALAAPQISVENVLVKQPDVIITAASQPTSQAQRLAYWSRLRLPAALKHHVYAIDPDELFRPGPRLIAAGEKLCRELDWAR
jgi:iron complex transport system substrate-binding protein/vitamin B12 transport system substrate-binding protein